MRTSQNSNVENQITTEPDLIKLPDRVSPERKS